jgi:hypothetical protein
MPATEAAAKVNLAEAAEGREEDFSAVIRRMEEQAKAAKGTPAGVEPAAVMQEEEKH